MAARFKFSPAAGTFGLYTVPTPGSTDDAPLTAPLSNLDRVILHPELRYPGVKAVLTGTLSLPAASSTDYRRTERRTHTLGAHGVSGMPMIVGRLPGFGVSGASVPWTGTVCVQMPTINYASPVGPGASIRVSRWVSLGVDNAGNVVAYEVLSGAASVGPAAMSLDYEVLVIDRDLTATLPNSGPTRMRVNGTAFEFVTPKGTMTSAHRYIREVSSGGFALSGGRTATIKANYRVGTSIVKETTFKNSFGSGVYEIAADYVLNGPGGQWYLPAAAVSSTMKTVAI